MDVNKARMRIRVPASTANLGSGFDSIGVAFQLYLTLESEPSTKLHFTWQGPELEGITIKDKDNLILEAMKVVFEREQQDVPALLITVHSDIPLTRGLGSSASAYVAGLVLANEYLGQPLSDKELYWLAIEKEGHADNVGASIFGGVCLASVDWQKKDVVYHQQSFPKQWQWIAAIPSYPLSTAKSRDILPEAYAKADAVYNLSRYGLLVSSLLQGNREGLILGLEDRLHQPYRASLIPGFAQLLQEKEELGVLGFVISGAGPTVLALVDEHTDQVRVIQAMQNYMTVTGQHVTVKPLAVDNQGYRVEK